MYKNKFKIALLLALGVIPFIVSAQEAAIFGQPANKPVAVSPDADIVLTMSSDAADKQAIRTLKKKILATGFSVRVMKGFEDLDGDIALEVPRDLMLKMDASNKFITKFNPELLLPDEMVEGPSIRLLRQLAEYQDSQFVITGEIVNVGTDTTPKYFGLMQTQKRRFELEVSLYDGLTGVLISKRRHSCSVDHDVEIGRNKPFGSISFNSTHFGTAIEKLMNQVVNSLIQDLDQQPFLAHVVKMKNGEVTLDAGASSALQAGDVLNVYQLPPELPARNLVQPIEYGARQSLSGTIYIRQVQDRFSSASFTPADGGGEIKVGDLLRFDVSKK